MSRSLKDKYENTNPRRNHTIMSPEDAASGKKSYWSELEITGTVLFLMAIFLVSIYILLSNKIC